MNVSFQHIIHYILIERSEVHIIYSINDCFCALTDKRGNRYVIDESYKFDEVVQILNQIKKVNNYGTQRLQRKPNYNS